MYINLVEAWEARVEIAKWGPYDESRALKAWMNPPRKRWGKPTERRGTRKIRVLLLGEGVGGDIDPEEAMQNEAQ